MIFDFVIRQRFCEYENWNFVFLFIVSVSLEANVWVFVWCSCQIVNNCLRLRFFAFVLFVVVTLSTSLHHLFFLYESQVNFSAGTIYGWHVFTAALSCGLNAPPHRPTTPPFVSFALSHVTCSMFCFLIW